MRRRLSGSRLILAAMLGLIAVPGHSVVGRQPRQLELAVKATFLPKFMAYVDWPSAAMPPPTEPLHLCVIGHDPFGQRLDQAIVGQRVEQRMLVVRRLETTEGAAGCRLAFVGGSQAQSAAAALKALQDAPVLTVTDARLGPARGMVHFELSNGRVRFHIDDAGAAASGLAISSRLLELALTVQPRERQR